MLKFFILGWFFLMGLNSVVNFFIDERWIYKNNKNFVIYIIGIIFLDFIGIKFLNFLIPDCWRACLQGLSFWWC